jgi:hypothetical protein
MGHIKSYIMYDIIGMNIIVNIIAYDILVNRLNTIPVNQAVISGTLHSPGPWPASAGQRFLLLDVF